jgi:chromosome segregation ATPase
MSAMGRLFRNIWYFFTGRVDRISEGIEKDPTVIRRQFDVIINQRKMSINQYVEAVSGLIAVQEKKKARLEYASKELERLAKLRNGAIAMAKSRMDDLQKKAATKEQIEADVTYQKCLTGFQDFSSSISQYENECKSIEIEIQTSQKEIDSHKIRLEQLKRSIDEVKKEKDATVADMISAKEEDGINKVLAGISTDTTGEMLERLRDNRQKAKARARTTRELAQTDVQQSMAEFEKFAATSGAKADFNKLIGLSEPMTTETALPEAAKDQSAKLTE